MSPGLVGLLPRGLAYHLGTGNSSLVVRPPVLFFTQLSATDVSVRTTMKGAAKCDKHCELQNSVNQQGFERILRFRDIPESMPASVSTSYHASGAFLASRQVKAGLRVSVHLSAIPGLRCM